MRSTLILALVGMITGLAIVETTTTEANPTADRLPCATQSPPAQIEDGDVVTEVGTALKRDPAAPEQAAR